MREVAIDEIRRSIGSHAMDIRVENGISQYVTHAERESAWECLGVPGFFVDARSVKSELHGASCFQAGSS